MAVLTGRRRAWRRLAGGLTAIALGLPWPGALAQPDEAAVKAAFIYNFGRFVVWPGEPAEPGGRDAGPLVVCALAHEPVGSALKATEGRAPTGRVLQVRVIERLRDARGCHIAFVGASDRGKAERLIEEAGGSPVLTVSDVPGFARAGGMIELGRTDSQIELHINPAVARSAGLQLSARLLRLAVIE